MTQAEYIKFVFAAVDSLKTNILAPAVGSSRILTRYITSEGTDDEQWLAKLRDENEKVDIFVMTIALIVGKPENQRDNDSVGTFTKPVSIAVDGFLDYKQGLDYTEDGSGDMLTTNSERIFLEKIIGMDFQLENKKGCLQDNIRINGWSFRLKIKRFVNSSAHWATGIINLELQDVIL